MKKYLMPGLILILAGVYFLLDALPGLILPNGSFLVLVGIVLLISRMLTRGAYGFSIAGFIVLCLGASRMVMDLMMLQSKYTIAITPIAISVAFFLVHIFEYRRIGNWPMIPALILLCVGGFFFLSLTPSLRELLGPYYAAIFPSLLILLGVVLLVRGLIRGNKQKKAPPRNAYAGYNSNPGDPSSWAQPPMDEQPAPAAPPQPEEAEKEPIITAEYTYTDPTQATDENKHDQGEDQ